MRIAVFSAKPFDRAAFDEANLRYRHELVYLEAGLTLDSAERARGCGAVCVFVSDRLDAPVLACLATAGVRLVVLRSAGFDHVDLQAAVALGITVAHVPAYSPHAIAEHAVALLLALDRHIAQASARTRAGNFLLDGLMGFDLDGKTVAVIGTGRIGSVLCRILTGFGCRLLAHDPYPDESVRATGTLYVSLDRALAEADVISLHVPLDSRTRHLIDARAVGLMKPGVVLINTSRGAVVDTEALLRGLESGRIGAAGLDVYEHEAPLFFRDRSATGIEDPLLARLLALPNVIVTPHQAFFTREALANIAETTLANASAFQTGRGKLWVAPCEDLGKAHRAPAPSRSSRPIILSTAR